MGLHARRDGALDDKWEYMSESGKYGVVDLTVDVQKLTDIDAFDSADIQYKQNGVLSVFFFKDEKLERAQPEKKEESPRAGSERAESAAKPGTSMFMRGRKVGP